MVLYKSGETVNSENRQHRRKTGLAALLFVLVSVTSNAQVVSQTINHPRAPDAKAMMCAELHGNTQKHWIKSHAITKLLENAFYMISPTQTPFLTMCGRTKAEATYHEWQTDELAAAADNAQIEGDDASGGTSTPSVRYGNYIQDSSKYAVVTDDQQAVTSAGNVNKMAHQVAKRLSELKLDIEFSLTRNFASSAGSASVARHLGSLESWLWKSAGAATLGNSISASNDATASTPSFATLVVAGPTDASSTSAFVVANLKTVIVNCWTSGGDPQIVMVGGATKQVVSGFAGIATIYREAGKTAKGTAIIGAADWEQLRMAA